MRGTAEFYEVCKQFEKDIKKSVPGSYRLDREKRGANIPTSAFYEDGKTNDLFLAYLLGYSLGKCQGGLTHANT